MALTDLGARRMAASVAEPVPGASSKDPRLEALEAELRMMRSEFVQLRELIVEREQKGRTLVNAYRDVIAELADLFEAERKENVKREESLRFFLASIEKRLRENIRDELGIGGGTIDPDRRRPWPFGRRRKS
jgi:hypothetical protein